MKMLSLLAMLTMLLGVSCGDKKRNNEFDLYDGDLTVQLVRKAIHGEVRTMLMLCNDRECRNTLRHRNGDEFYFPQNIGLDTVPGKHNVIDTRNIVRHNRLPRAHNTHHVVGNYRHVGSSQHVGNTYGVPHVGVSFINGRVGFHYSTNTNLRYHQNTNLRYYQNVGGRFSRIRARTHLPNRYDNDGRGLEFIGYDHNGRAVYAQRNTDMVAIYPDTTNAVGSVADTIELMRAIADTSQWDDREHSLEQLFLHGKAVRVNKRELHRLLDVVSDYFNVVIDTQIENLLERR